METMQVHSHEQLAAALRACAGHKTDGMKIIWTRDDGNTTSYTLNPNSVSLLFNHDHDSIERYYAKIAKRALRLGRK